MENSLKEVTGTEGKPVQSLTPRRKVGPKGKATAARLAVICKAISAGQTLTSAARIANIHPSTLFAWMDNDPQICEQIQEAEGKAEEMLINLAIAGAVKDGRIALMMLERRFAHWRKKETVTHAHVAGDALKTLVDTRRERDRKLLGAPPVDVECEASPSNITSHE